MVQYTKAAIINEFKKQALQNPVDSITVRGIANALGMNVKTFYYHFRGIPDMILRYTEEELKALVKDNYRLENWYDGLLKIIEYAKTNAPLIKAISTSKYWAEVRMLYMDLYKRHIMRMLDNFIAVRDVAASENVREITADYYSLLFYVLLEKWVFGNMRLSPSSYLDLCTSLLGRDALLAAMQRLAEYELEST